MVKKRLSSSDTVFRFEVPGSPSKAGGEAPHSSTDSPSPASAVLRNPPYYISFRPYKIESTPPAIVN